MWTLAFWRGAADRSLKSAAQSLLLLWGADQFSLLNVQWMDAAGIAGGFAVLSLLTSIASGYVGDKGTTSLLPDAR